MENHYTAPNAALKDDMIARGRMAHIIFAAISGFLVMPLCIGVFLAAFGGDPAMFNYGRLLIGSVFCAAGSGASVTPFRTIAWYWAVPIGIVVAVVFMSTVGVIIGYIASVT